MEINNEHEKIIEFIKEGRKLLKLREVLLNNTIDLNIEVTAANIRVNDPLNAGLYNFLKENLILRTVLNDLCHEAINNYPHPKTIFFEQFIQNKSLFVGILIDKIDHMINIVNENLAKYSIPPFDKEEIK